MELFNNNENNQIKKSAIYVVATPIGNMEDITIRALKTLNNVDFILAEDTRVAIKLLNFYKIKKPLYSYHSHSSENKINHYIENILKGNSGIEVVIDLHRDGIDENRRLVTEINGKPTAKILFYNGLSYTNTQGKVSYLPNPYIQDNLAFSFQLEYQAALYYPDFYRGIYLAGLRYNLHLKKRALLLEAGAQTNTVQEVKNAMEPFADILNRVLQGNK